MNNGFHDLAGRSATASVAAWANRLEAPMTNPSKVYRELRPATTVTGGELAVVEPDGVEVIRIAVAGCFVEVKPIVEVAEGRSPFLG